jgi:polysaccharide biosynthesis protein PslG
LLKASYPVVKANDSTAIVIGGSLAPCISGDPNCFESLSYLDGMYTAGAKGYFDRLAYHSYTWGNSPTWYDPNQLMRSYSYSVPAIWQHMQNHGDMSPIWLTETGWATLPAANTEEEQAAYLAEAVNIARAWDYVEVYIWYELIDTVVPPTPDESSEYHFGLFRKDYSAKPAVEQFTSWTLPCRVFLPVIIR